MKDYEQIITTLLANFLDSMLMDACSKNLLNLVSQLLNVGASALLNEAIEYAPNRRISPLFNACTRNHVEIAKLLIENNANILQVNDEGVSLLMVAPSIEMCELLITEAEKQGCLTKLIAIKDNLNNATAYSWQCSLGNTDIVDKLMEIDHWEKVINIRFFLSSARNASWNWPDKHQYFHILCEKIRKITTPLSVVAFDENQAYHPALSSFSIIADYSSKSMAIKQTLVKLSKLFFNPQLCIKYLKFLNDEFVRYYQEKYQTEFPEIDPNGFKFEIINGIYYPIPTKDFTGIENKRSSLQEYLICLFKKYGLANTAYQWLGFIPHAKADEMIRQGCFFTESSIGTGLFHGKLSHKLQDAMIILAIEAGEIDLSYNVNERTEQLTMSDILNAFVSLKDQAGDTIWQTVRDARAYNRVAFNDPHRLSSVIMYDGKKLGLTALSSFMIDSFCKSWIKYIEALRHITAFKNIDTNELLKQVNDRELHVFADSHALISYCFQRTTSKRTMQINDIDHTANYAIIPKTYHVNPFFQPRFFSNATVVDVAACDKHNATQYQINS